MIQSNLIQSLTLNKITSYHSNLIQSLTLNKVIPFSVLIRLFKRDNKYDVREIMPTYANY